jgi:multidrug transporter EmrE-like cation transporter
MYFALVVIASFLEYYGDANFKFFARSSNYKYLFMGLFIYLIMIALLIYLLTISNVMYMNSLWDATSIILETSFAYIFLGERMNNQYQYLGLFFIIIGIALLNVGVIPYK